MLVEYVFHGECKSLVLNAMQQSPPEYTSYHNLTDHWNIIDDTFCKLDTTYRCHYWATISIPRSSLIFRGSIHVSFNFCTLLQSQDFKVCRTSPTVFKIEALRRVSFWRALKFQPGIWRVGSHPRHQFKNMEMKYKCKKILEAQFHNLFPS